MIMLLCLYYKVIVRNKTNNNVYEVFITSNIHKCEGLFFGLINLDWDALLKKITLNGVVGLNYDSFNLVSLFLCSVVTT